MLFYFGVIDNFRGESVPFGYIIATFQFMVSIIVKGTVDSNSEFQSVVSDLI